MKKDKILLVEDDSTLSCIVQDALEREGFEVVCAANGEAGLELFAASKPDAIVADVMMPRMDGFEMVRRIRATDAFVPVLFLTARTAIVDVVKGFGIGANDYLRKPFQILELVVRIRALLQRSRTPDPVDTQITAGDCTLSPVAQKLKVGDRSFELSHIESLILGELFRNANKVVEARELMFRIWNNDDYNNLNRLHGFVYKLRKLLSDSRAVELLNARGIGYKLTVKG